MSFREAAPYFAFAFACYCASPFLGLDSRDVDPRIAEVWPPGGVGFVLLTTIWFAGRRVVAATLAAMFVIFVGTAIAMDYAPLVSGWMALTGVAQPLLMTWWYRRRLSHPGWAPQTPSEVGALLYAAVGSSVLLGLLGGFPLLSADDLFSEVLVWWVLRNVVFCFVGGVSFMVMFYGRRSTTLPPSSMLNRVALVTTAVLCVYGTYHDPSLPLSWLLIVPSVWGGLTLTVRGTGYLAITVALLSAAMTYLPQNAKFGYDGLLPASSIVDLLIIASTAFLLLLTLMRDQRGSLIDQLDRNGRKSETQRQVLETVFNSMTDGVIIVVDSKVTLFNHAARQLLGRPLPVETPVSWTHTFGLSSAEGVALDDAALFQRLFQGGNGQPRSVEVRVGPDAAPRILEVTAQPLGDAADLSTILMLHDVTAQRARLRELSNFAGMVAHDLRGPLTVLDGWLEVVQDGGTEDDLRLVAGDAVAKARDASKRMRQVIEDWLNYTVVQNGQLRPDSVKLEDVTTEIIASRRAHWAEADEPRFVVDLSHEVEADPGLLRQLLDNLVGNAIKYTPADRAPWIEISSQPDQEPGWIRVNIVDRGIGLPDGQEERIFQEFHRGPVEGRTAGTGLGLALTRRIVELHGGEISASTNADGGSRFSFTLPEA